MEKVKFNIDTFKAVALSVQTANKVSKDASADKGNKQNELGFFTLSALIHANNSELQTVLFLFSKEGPFYDLRVVLSRARSVLKELNEKGTIEVKTKNETNVFTMEQVKAWEHGQNPVFNVSTAYNSLSKEKQAPNQEEKAIAAYMEKEGMTKQAFKEMADMRPNFKAEAIAQGQIYLAEQVKAEKIATVPALIDNLRTAFAELKGLDDDAAYELLQSLIADYQATPDLQAVA